MSIVMMVMCDLCGTAERPPGGNVETLPSGWQAVSDLNGKIIHTCNACLGELETVRKKRKVKASAQSINLQEVAK